MTPERQIEEMATDKDKGAVMSDRERLRPCKKCGSFGDLVLSLKAWNTRPEAERKLYCELCGAPAKTAATHFECWFPELSAIMPREYELQRERIAELERMASADGQVIAALKGKLSEQESLRIGAEYTIDVICDALGLPHDQPNGVEMVESIEGSKREVGRLRDALETARAHRIATRRVN